VGCQPKNIAKNGNFWYKFSRKGYKLIPLSDFDNIFSWGREPQDRTLVPNSTVVALKMWPYGPQNGPKW